MSRKCEICGKGPQFGNKISHAHNTSRRRWNPNVRKLRVMVGGKPKRANVCADCITAGKAVRPPRTSPPSPVTE